MFKKIISGVLIAMMLVSLMSIVALADEPFVMNTSPATPYREQVITNARNSYIEAVWFDPSRGEDFTVGGGRYIRTEEDAVANTEGGGSGFEGNIGWTAAGEWVQYTVTVEEADTYRVYAYLASDVNPPGNIRVYIDNVLLGYTESDDTSGWQNYTWWYVGDATLTPGQIVIGVYFIDGATNLAALRFGTEAGSIATAAENAANIAETAANNAGLVAETAAEAEAYAEGAPAGSPPAIHASEARDAANAAAAYAATAASYAEAAAAATTMAAAEEALAGARAANASIGQQRTAANTARNQARQAAAALAAEQEAPGDDNGNDDTAPADTGDTAPPPADDDDGINMVLIIVIAVIAVVIVVVIVIIATKKKKAA